MILRYKEPTAFHTGESPFFKVDEMIAMSFVKYPGISWEEAENFVSSILVIHILYILFLLLHVLYFCHLLN